MSTTKSITLGISPGTRHIGLAVLAGPWLREWRVRRIQGADDFDRITAMTRIIKRMMLKHGVTAIAVKINPLDRSSPLIEQMVDGIKLLSVCNSVPCTAYSIEKLYDHCLISDTQPRNKVSLAVSLLSKFKNLDLAYRTACAKWGLHYYKVFEAVACAYTNAEKANDWVYEKLNS